MNTLPKTYPLLIAGLVITASLLPFLIYYGNPELASLTRTGMTGMVSYQGMPVFEQWMAVLGGFVIKPVYMVLSFLLIVILRNKKVLDLLMLRWGLVFFLAGEIFCFFNYVFYHEDSAFLEHLHSFGMVLGTGFMFLAFLEGMDYRILKYSRPDNKCAALDLCLGCVKYKGVPCGLRRLFLFIIPALCAVTFIPMTALPQVVSYNTTVIGTLYNYSHAVIHQLYEIRYCPWAGIGFFTIAFLTLLLDKKHGINTSKCLLASGTGYLSFSMMRLILLQTYTDNMIWFVFWEEATELLLIAGIGAVLWIFQKKLL